MLGVSLSCLVQHSKVAFAAMGLVYVHTLDPEYIGSSPIAAIKKNKKQRWEVRITTITIAIVIVIVIVIVHTHINRDDCN